MNTVLVTGGAGFIGSSVIDRLLILGYKVITIDNFNDYYDPAVKERNISELLENMENASIDKRQFTVHRADIREMRVVTEVFKNDKVDSIIHLAAMAGVRPSIQDPRLYYDVNINGTLNILEAARSFGVKKFVFASSSSVYGSNSKAPFREDDPVDHPISPYAASKKAGELLCHTYYHLYGISTACLRFFTVYGPRQRPDLAIHKFARLMMKGESVPFYGDGSTERDYTYIEDIVDGIVCALQWLDVNKNQYEIFNLGESRSITLREMLGTLEKVLGLRAHLKKLPLQSGDVQRTYADISKAKDLLGYFPRTEFEEGIEAFIKWLTSVEEQPKG